MRYPYRSGLRFFKDWRARPAPCRKGWAIVMEIMFVMGGMAAFFIFMMAAYAVSSAAIVRALGLFGYEKPVAGWIPGLRYYALGTVCTQRQGSLQGVVSTACIPNACLQWGWAAVMAAYFIPGIGNLLGLALSVLYYGTVYRFIYSRLFGDDSAVAAVVSSVVRIVFYIRILACPCGENGVRSLPGDIYPKGGAEGRKG